VGFTAELAEARNGGDERRPDLGFRVNSRESEGRKDRASQRGERIEQGERELGSSLSPPGRRRQGDSRRRGGDGIGAATQLLADDGEEDKGNLRKTPWNFRKSRKLKNSKEIWSFRIFSNM